MRAHRICQFRPTQPARICHRAVRVLAGPVAVFALLLQLLAPSLAHAAGTTWVEICADGVVERVQVDLTGPDGAPVGPHPDCDTCVLCAVAPAAAPPAQAAFAGFAPVAQRAILLTGPFVCATQRGHWPEVRGPPEGPRLPTPALAGPTAPAAFPSFGGAPWL